MKDESVYPLNDKWYCKACFDKLDTGISAASRDILSQKCHKCYKEFSPGSLVSECKSAENFSFILITFEIFFKIKVIIIIQLVLYVLNVIHQSLVNHFIINQNLMIDNQKRNFYVKIVILKMRKNVQNVKIK
jgi:hypothetical protein